MAKPDLTTASAQQPVRVIIRFSLNGDTTSTVRNEIASHLVGFTRTKTSTWESNPIPLHAAHRAIQRLTRTLRDAETLYPGAHVDHLWIYLDQTALEFDEDGDDDEDG